MAFALPLRAAYTSNQHPLIAALQNGLQTLFQSPASLIELLPPILLAVPKSKVSHSRKRMRAANKHLQEKQNIVTCPGCGRAKASHNLCPHCYSSLSRGFKTEAKQLQKVSNRQSSPAQPSFFNDNGGEGSGRSLADSDWARQRGGAIPVQPGQLLTKWMRAKLGYSKSDKPVRMGQEDKVVPTKPRNAKRSNSDKEDQDGSDDHHDHHDGGMPPNLRFA